MTLPRLHPIAMNSAPQADPLLQNHYRRYAPPPQEQIPPQPAQPLNPSPPQLEHIEARLRQLEHEEAARTLARSHQLAVREREDEEFRRLTETAELEEEDLRRQRKRLKRESMGLTYDPLVDSPPLPAQPRRLSETNAATTLAFFKQQTPPDFRQYQPQPQPQPQPQQHQQQPPLPPQAPTPIIHDVNVGGALRRKQKYTIKNVEAWGERHGRPAAHDPSGRALWKRPSDGSLVYLTCPISGCEKDDFVTLHGFMCHLTKKHKDRSLGSQSRALEICGIVYDPNAPLLPVPKMHRDSTEESQPESAPADANSHELEYSSSAVEDDDEPVPPHAVKTEPVDRAPPFARTPVGPEDDATTPPLTNRSTKPSISSIIDHEPEDPPREMLSESAPPPFIDAAAAVTPASSHQSADGNNEFKDSPDTK